MKKWTSNAQWPLDVYCGMDGSGITTGSHDSRESAQAVCAALRSEGFGGERKHFPIRTWVEEKQAGMKDKLMELAVALAKECSESDKDSRIRVATVRFFIKKMLAILEQQAEWPSDELHTVDSVRAELVAKIGDCCQGGDPLCAGGCLAQEAARRNAALQSVRPPSKPDAGVVSDVSEQLVDAIRHRVGCEDGLDITPAQVRCVLRHERIIAAPPAPEKD